MLDVCLLGTGGMMPLPGRWLTSLYLRCNGSCLLIDCGEGTQVAIRAKGLSFNPIDTILITHYHGDHISGLPGLLLSMGNAERTEPVSIYGPKGIEKVVSALRVIAPELPFPVNLYEITGPSQTFTVHDYEITAFRLSHSITTYGYSVNIRRTGRFLPELAAENNVPMRCWSHLQKGETVEFEGRRFTPDMVLGPERKGIKLTYCTDTRPIGSIARFAENSDLFICEGMYGEKEMAAKAMEHNHMTFFEAAGLAKQANAKELWLTHYSPMIVHPEEYLPVARAVFPNTKAAKDGRSVTLEFEKDD